MKSIQRFFGVSLASALLVTSASVPALGNTNIETNIANILKTRSFEQVFTVDPVDTTELLQGRTIPQALSEEFDLIFAYNDEAVEEAVIELLLKSGFDSVKISDYTAIEQKQIEITPLSSIFVTETVRFTAPHNTTVPGAFVASTTRNGFFYEGVIFLVSSHFMPLGPDGYGVWTATYSGTLHRVHQ